MMLYYRLAALVHRVERRSLVHTHRLCVVRLCSIENHKNESQPLNYHPKALMYEHNAYTVLSAYCALHKL